MEDLLPKIGYAHEKRHLWNSIPTLKPLKSFKTADEQIMLVPQQVKDVG